MLSGGGRVEGMPAPVSLGEQERHHWGLKPQDPVGEYPQPLALATPPRCLATELAGAGSSEAQFVFAPGAAVETCGALPSRLRTRWVLARVPRWGPATRNAMQVRVSAAGCPGQGLRRTPTGGRPAVGF